LKPTATFMRSLRDEFFVAAITSLDVGKAADLAAVVVDDQRPARQRRIDEPRQDHAVRAALPRPDDVEEPADHHRQTVLAPTGQRQELVDRFGRAVGPAGLGRRAEDQVVVLVQERGFGFLPYTSLVLARKNFTCWPRAQRSTSASSSSSVGWMLRSIVSIGWRAIKATPTAAARWYTSSTWAVTRAARSASPMSPSMYVKFEDAPARPPGSRTARRLVVDHGHAIAAGQQGFGQMRADESGAAGYQNGFTV
jgi:hypothetical protein